MQPSLQQQFRARVGFSTRGFFHIVLIITTINVAVLDSSGYKKQRTGIRYQTYTSLIYGKTCTELFCNLLIIFNILL